MKKQYTYVKMMPRVFAFTLDTFILLMVTSPIIKWINLYLLNLNNINIPNINPQLQLQELIFSTNYLTFLIESTVTNILMLFAYFVGMWIKFDTTPGKFMIRAKIIDAKNLGKPSATQYIKRFLGYSLGFFSLITISFSKEQRGIHDKIANTVVVKI